MKKTPISKFYLLFDFIYVTFLKYQNFRDRLQISGFQVLAIDWGDGGEGVSLLGQQEGALL